MLVIVASVDVDLMVTDPNRKGQRLFASEMAISTSKLSPSDIELDLYPVELARFAVTDDRQIVCPIWKTSHSKASPGSKRWSSILTVINDSRVPGILEVGKHSSFSRHIWLLREQDASEWRVLELDANELNSQVKIPDITTLQRLSSHSDGDALKTLLKKSIEARKVLVSH